MMSPTAAHRAHRRPVTLKGLTAITMVQTFAYIAPALHWRQELKDDSAAIHADLAALQAQVQAIDRRLSKLDGVPR